MREEVEEENIVDWVFDCYAEWLLSSGASPIKIGALPSYKFSQNYEIAGWLLQRNEFVFHK